MTASNAGRAAKRQAAKAFSHEAADGARTVPGGAPRDDAALSPNRQAGDPASFVSCLSRTLAAANRFLTERLREEGLSGLVPSHGDILVQLFGGNAMTMQGLAQAIGRDPSTVTALVRKLAGAGYVATEKSAADRRVTEVTLTGKGAALEEAFRGISAELLAVQMHGVERADFDVACSVLNTVRRNFAEAADGAAEGFEERNLS